MSQRMGFDRNAAIRRFAVYLSISSGVGLAAIAMLLPDIIANPKLTAATSPIAQLLVPGFIAAFVGYGSAVYAGFYEERPSGGVVFQRLSSWLTVIASLAVAASLVMLVLALLLFGETVNNVQITPL